MRLKFVSPSDPFEVAFFRVAKGILGFLGLWPLDSFDRVTKIKVFINLSVMVVAIVGELRFTWFTRKEPIEALAAICPCLTKVVTVMKLFCFVIYRKEFAELLKGLYTHLVEDAKDTRKNAIIGKVSFFANVWYLVLFFIGISTNCLYTLKPLIAWANRRFIEKKVTWVSLPFPAALPYKDMTQLQNKILYSFVYCFLAYSGNVTIFGFPGADGTFMCFCMYISVSCQCLQEDFKQTFEKYTSNWVTAKSEELYEELSLLVKQQQNITLMFNRFNRVYRFMIFAHFLFAAIVLGVVLINLVLFSGISKIINVIYALGASSQLYSYCYGAESVNESCLKLSETLYFCDWYKCDKRVKRLVLFIMIKSQRGSELNVPFFSPSLPLFSAITKTSGSYLTLLETFL